jgi:hypothetical protein
MIKKYAAVLALAVSAALFLPEVMFAQGAVVGYASGDCGNVTDQQLDRLTHVMAVDVYPNAQGYLYSQTIRSISSSNPIQKYSSKFIV